MHAIPFRIPRTFFANLLAPPSHPLVADMGLLTRRTLPHGAAAATLVQIVMDEPSFQAERSALNERLLALRALRVYEDTLPPTYNACLQVRGRQQGWMAFVGGGPLFPNGSVCSCFISFLELGSVSLWSSPWGYPPMPHVVGRDTFATFSLRSVSIHLLHFHTQLGCVTALNAPSEAQNLGSGVDLAELGMKTVTEVGLRRVQS